MAIVDIAVRLSPPGSVEPAEAHAFVGDTVRWNIDRGTARVQFLGFSSGAPGPVSQNIAVPGAPATAIASRTGRWAYVVYGYATGEDPDSEPSPSGATPLSVGAVLIVESAIAGKSR